MTLEEIKEMIKLVTDTGIAELEVTRGENTVRIRRSIGVAAHEVAAPVAQAAPIAPPTPPAGAPEAEPQPAEEEGLQYVKSPIVGTFYEAPAPDAAPFVRVGDHVTPGQVLCIIESMKLMNEIEAELAGTITGKLVENGQPVEYGEALFSVKPD